MSVEAQRQQALLAAFTASPGHVVTPPLRETGERAERGIEVYRANAEALAERALGAVFATVQAMLGEEDFAHLAADFWRVHPPQRGDMGEWGEEFPAWLAAHRAMAPWPYLGDCARLDLALHRNERAADAVFDAASLTLLESTEPEQLRLMLMPGTELLRSTWPVGTIHHAHHAAADQSEAAFETVRVALEPPRAEAVLVVREGWRAVVHLVDRDAADWIDALLRGHSLDAALSAAGNGFDFASWLGTALRRGWLKGAAELATDASLIAQVRSSSAAVSNTARS